MIENGVNPEALAVSARFPSPCRAYHTGRLPSSVVDRQVRKTGAG